VWRKVTRAALADLGRGHVVAHQVRESVRREGFAGDGQKEHAGVGLDDELRPPVREVLLDPGRCAIADRHHAVLLTLALAHHHGPRSRSRS
jgi:hypothetical protein